MKKEDVLTRLKGLGDPKTKAHNTKSGVGEKQYGVKLGDLRKVAKELKTNHPLALELWETGNYDAQMLAVLLMKPRELNARELDKLVRSATHDRVADWLNAYVVKVHPDHEALRQEWMKDPHPMAARSGWYLTSLLVGRKPEVVDLPGLLDRIEKEMGTAAPETQWTMNFTLAEIGIQHGDLRNRAIGIGEKLGIYRDYPVSKGCTSPFAPIWIREMVSRQK